MQIKADVISSLNISSQRFATYALSRNARNHQRSNSGGARTASSPGIDRLVKSSFFQKKIQTWCVISLDGEPWLTYVLPSRTKWVGGLFSISYLTIQFIIVARQLFFCYKKMKTQKLSHCSLRLTCNAWERLILSNPQ